MTVLYTRIPNELKRDLKILSFDQGVPLKEVVTEALSQYAVENCPEVVRRKTRNREDR